MLLVFGLDMLLKRSESEETSVELRNELGLDDDSEARFEQVFSSLH